ncbi:MAG: hypothetical protein JW984_03240 [Deltaproteobacteria bacterium]|uniref:Zinc finger/thioredoxin putative domain-containing protein n=1 Tax=Candidatus Zymogenus saltonus TaxID=2844893 RepID=A0A9D8PM81_9DELT|nr:hypothetical protein [Candidatus Zymogenus saltonus]
MKTICPICGFENERLDRQIPKREKNITCPRCEHTYFVERSTYPDIEKMDDSAGLDISPEVEPADEIDQEDEEMEPEEDRGHFGGSANFEKTKSVLSAVFLTVFALFSMLGVEVPIGIIAILVAAIILLVEFMV